MNRRNFLRTTAATSFALSVVPIFGADSTAKKYQYRTALVGCGWWG